MTQTIYVDILFAVNLFMNFFLLLVTARLAHQPYKRLRLLAGAALGALFSFVILLPELGILFSIATKVVFSALIVLASFHAASLKRFLKLYACFFTVNFAFAGIAFALWLFVAPPGLAMGNGAFYFDISPLLLVVTAAAAYLLLSLFPPVLPEGGAAQIHLRPDGDGGGAQRNAPHPGGHRQFLDRILHRFAGCSGGISKRAGAATRPGPSRLSERERRLCPPAGGLAAALPGDPLQKRGRKRSPSLL